MNSAEDCPIGHRRAPGSLRNSLFLNAGYVLLVIGCALLLFAALTGVHPLIPAVLSVSAALILFPVRSWLQRFWAGKPASGGLPSAQGAADPADLLQLAQLLHSASDPDILLELIAAQVLRRTPAASFRIAWMEEDTASLSYAYYFESGLRRAERERTPFPVADDLIGEVVRTGRPLAVGDYSEACRIRNLPVREPPAAWAGFPLPAGASVFGAMTLMRETPFSESEQRILEAIAAVAGPAVAKAREGSESIRRSALLGVLVRASRRVIGAADRAGSLDAILSGARELLPSQAALLLLPDPSGAWRVERNTGPAESDWTAVGLDHPLAKVETGDRPTFVRTLPADDPFHASAQRRLPPLLCATSLPLRRREKILGWIVFWNPLRPFPPSESETVLLNEFAAVCVSALDCSRPRTPSHMSASALVEELTSLQQLDQELSGAKDTAGAMAVTLDWAIRFAQFPAGLAAVYKENSFEVAAVRGYPDGSGPEEKTLLPPETAGLSEAIRTRKLVLRLAEESVIPGLLPLGKSCLCLPIRRNEQTLGVLLLESDSEEAIPAADAEFLERLASHAAIAISNAQLNAEVRSANQTKSEFISFVAHELKTPMTSIRGYTDLVAQGAVGPVSQQQANFLATIRLNVDRMSALVSDLNDVSRIESGRLKLEFAAVFFQPALDEVLEALRAQIEGKQQKLTLEIPADLPPVWVDRGRLIQILTNLVSNAYKYTPTGGSVRIAAERLPNRWDPVGPPEVVHFLIQDSGLGISLQEQKSIFQKFFRSEDGTVRDIPGTGLGLHITRNLVEMHGGRIWFESELHKGSTFHFTVPTTSV
jgi:signal transduction histidine kinase